MTVSAKRTDRRWTILRMSIYMTHARPDLFYAYVGEAQMVNRLKNLLGS